MSRGSKADDKLKGRSRFAEDAMHVYHCITETDDKEITDEDRERFLQNLQHARTERQSSPEGSTQVAGGIDQALRALDHSPDDGEVEQGNILERLRVSVASYFESKHFPNPFSLVITKTDEWRPLPDDWHHRSNDERAGLLSKGEGVEIGWAYTKRIAAPLSDPHFAAELASRIAVQQTLSGRKRQDALLRIGFLSAQWDSRRHLSDVKRGKDVKKAASMGGTAKGKAMASDKEERIAEMKRLISQGKSERSAAKIAAIRGYGTTARANRKMLQRAKKARRNIS